MSRHRFELVLVLVIVGAVFPLAGCGGGGGGGGGGGASGGDPVLLRITAAGIQNPLWQLVAGTPVSPPNCTSPVFLNSTLTFTFGGAVSPSSVPGGGFALGSINITTGSGGATVAALGQFAIADDPSLPAGNRRRVNFLPTPPSDPNNPNTAGLSGNSTYTIFVPRTGNSTQVVNVAGAPLTNDATTCFFTCDSATLGSACFTDPVPGSPFIVSSTPNTGDPSPPPVNPIAVGTTISLFFSEPLFPQGININNVRVQTQSGAQVPGTVVFYQAGSPEAGPSGARIDYIASSQLLSNATYEILITNVFDFGNNPVVLYDPSSPTTPPSGRRLFQTVTVPTCPQTPIFESFDTTQNRASVTGEAQWNGTGQIVTTFPATTVGNGSFGNLAYPAGAGTLDPGQAQIVNGGQIAFDQGNWNLQNFSIAAGGNVRCTGHTAGNRWRIHLRCFGTVTIDGVLNATAGNLATAPTGTTEQGARAGNFNNGNPGNPTWVAGGVGGSGGGRGGHASQSDLSGPALRTPAAEAGFGPPLNGADNIGPFGANALFAGGAGGVGGFLFPQGGVSGELGGLGGAGGSSFTVGLNGGPNAAAPACTPLATTVQQRALATLSPAAFAANPILIASAGSGGGGGGDKFDPAGVANDDQGGGGGGGGGGIRISAIGSIFMNAGSSITVNGGTGGQGNVFQGGHGGGGSGGEIWMQSFAQVVISGTCNMQVNGGGVNNACGNQSGGRGGNGVYQFEDADGVINTAFTGIPAGGGNVLTATFPYSTTVVGNATSTFFDTGYGDPDYVSATSNATIQPPPVGAPGAVVNVTFQGAFENVSGGGPNLATLTAPVTGQNISALDGYRFIRFNVNISYTSPPASAVTNTFPTVEDVTITFNAPIGCP